LIPACFGALSRAYQGLKTVRGATIGKSSEDRLHGFQPTLFGEITCKSRGIFHRLF
jgi:hypothetical protein